MNDADGTVLDHLAEAIEHARYENMATARWADLRDGERAARTDLMQRSLAAAGVTAALSELRERVSRSDELARRVAERDSELARIAAEHETQVADLRAAHGRAVGELAEAVADLKTQLAETSTLLAAAERRAGDAEGLVAGVRAALTGIPHPDGNTLRSPEPAALEANATTPENSRAGRAALRNPFNRG